MLAGETPEPLRGAAARIVDNMEASLEVPTATSVRAVPAKLLEVNRQILNNHLARARGGKVSFTHLIGFAVLRALRTVPAMNASFGVVDGKPSVVHHEHVNLGLAIDMQRPDGSRTLIVPNVKQADTLDFAAFHAAYEDLIRRARANKLTPDDLAGTTSTITNPGTIGTMHSVPRLMPGQGVIVGVGAIIFPPEYESADPQTLAELGVGKVVTLTSTYDHRIIQGAESGEMLAAVHDLLVGAHVGGNGFYDDIFAEPRRSLRARALVAGPPPGAGFGRGAREGHRGAAARQHVPRARSPDREPRPARPEEAAHASRARPDPLGPHDLGPRPRVPHRRARRASR